MGSSTSLPISRASSPTAEEWRDATIGSISGGDLSGAEEALRRAILEGPSFAPRRDLGALLLAQRRFDAAAHALSTALDIVPDDFDALTMLAKARLRAGKWNDAVAPLSVLCELRPADIGFRLRLARTLVRSRRFAEAQTALHAVLDLDRACVDAYLWLAILYLDAGYVGFGLENIQWVASKRPDSSHVKRVLRFAHICFGHWEEANRIELQLRSEAAFPPAGSTELIARLHSPDSTRESLREAHCNWSPIQPAKPPSRAPGKRSGPRRIRIGYHSGEFCASPAFHFFTPLFRHRDRERFEVFCYAINSQVDARTEWYRADAEHFRQSAGDRSWEEIIANDELDVLVDLSGHYGFGRLDLFRHRFAPVQLVFPSYPTTTGMPGFDYIFTDRWVCPPGAESQYREPVWLLENGYLPYAPPCEPPVIVDTPSPVTFGLFQRPSKLNRGVWDAVAEVLRNADDSRLLIHYRSEELDMDGSPLREDTFTQLERRGIPRERIILRGAADHAEHMRIVAETTIALDTFPYNGQTTACECLWMGVPVVSLAGETHVSRVGWQILDRIGLGALCADSPASYVDTAVRLAHDRPRLQELRATLRDRMRASSMLDGRVVKEIEQAYISLTN